MERPRLQIALFGLLLAFVTTLPNKDDWDIYSFHINSTVTGRYATTVITSRVVNRIDASKEIEFQVRIPKNAFISKFRMFIDGELYDGVVKAKEEAQQQYTHAVSRGESAGIVSSVGRTLEEFKTSVNVAAHKKVTFELTYEELLTRKLGKYELQIHARPMQPVRDFKVDVHIDETAGISFLKVKGGLSKNIMSSAITKTVTDQQAWVHFYPTEDQQKTCENCGEHGMNGDLVIVYDANRGTSLGDIKKSAGYFVHHFAPSNLPHIPKNVVFVIDRSGSMHGRKMQQTRIALIHILNDLAEEDYFGLVTFDSSISHWKRELVQASAENLESAKAFARNIADGGATDINGAVLEGARMLNANPREGSASILILLTDGDPTTGVTNREEIQANVRTAIAKRFPLYCLGFGFDVNFEFLEKMSLQNSGVARRIYEDSDADLQLKGFYEEVATPLLTDVTMIYTGVTNVTQSNFSQYYNGSEIVVAGQITDNDLQTFIPEVVAISRNTRIVFSETDGTTESTETSPDSQIQRVWAYLTVKQLLDKELQLSGSEKEKAKNEALELSLKYNFVTPLTSMVVTKPPGERTDVLHKPKEGPPASFNPQRFGSSSPRLGSGRGARLLDAGPQMAGVIPSFPGHQGTSRFPMLSTSEDSRHRIAMTRRRKRPHQDITQHFPLAAADPPMFDMDGMFDYSAPRIFLPLRPTSAPRLHRFLLKTDVQSLPLCFDITGNAILKLLHHPNGEVFVNGELDSLKKGGFSKIVIHFQADHRIDIDSSNVIVRVGQGPLQLVMQDPVVIGRITVITRGDEIDITAGDTRIVIFRHLRGRQVFLWPVLRQLQSDSTTDGLLVQKAVYEEVHHIPSTKLRIKDREIDVTRSTAVDYGILLSPRLECWLISADNALQRSLGDFIVTEL